MPGHRLSRLAKGTPSESRLSIGTTGLGVISLYVRKTVETVKTRKMLFFGSEFFYVCRCANFQNYFRDGHVITFRQTSGAISPKHMPGHKLSRLAKGTPSESRLSIGTTGLGVISLYVRKTVETVKTRKMLFFGSGSAHAKKIPEFFMIAPPLSNQIKFIRYTRSQNTNRKLENKDIKRT